MPWHEEGWGETKLSQIAFFFYIYKGFYGSKTNLKEMFLCQTPGLSTRWASNSSFALRAMAVKPATEKVPQLHTTRISHPSRPWGAPLPAAPRPGCAQTLPNSSSRSHVFCKSQLKPHRFSAPPAALAARPTPAGFPRSHRRFPPPPRGTPVPGPGAHRPRRRETPAPCSSQAGMLRAEVSTQAGAEPLPSAPALPAGGSCRCYRRRPERCRGKKRRRGGWGTDRTERPGGQPWPGAPPRWHSSRRRARPRGPAGMAAAALRGRPLHNGGRRAGSTSAPPPPRLRHPPRSAPPPQTPGEAAAPGDGAAPPARPSPAAASRRARRAPGTGLSPPSWWRRGWGAAGGEGGREGRRAGRRARGGSSGAEGRRRHRRHPPRLLPHRRRRSPPRWLSRAASGSGRRPAPSLHIHEGGGAHCQ